MTWYQDVAAFIGVCLGAGMVALASRSPTRSQGKNMLGHVAIVGGGLACIFLLPEAVKELIFTPLTVSIIGTVFPIYESIRAVCTIAATDDATWLSYWIAQSILSFSTQWVDGLEENVTTNWNIIECFFYLWLILPFTDGATVFFDYLLNPLVTPIIQPCVSKTEGIISKIILAVTNAAHLSFVWIIFVFLPAGLKRAIWILLATLYPMAASVVSVTTPAEADDTFWLTYWSCFGILYIIVDFIENFLGKIPGFYTLAIACTVYLMLPLFRGAEQVFRYILVPIAGLQELLVRKDADTIRKQALAELPPARREIVMKEIAASFQKASLDKSDPKSSVSPTGYSQIV